MRARQWRAAAWMAWLAWLAGHGVSWRGVMRHYMACGVESPRVMCRSFPCAAGHYTGTLATESRSYAVHVALGGAERRCVALGCSKSCLNHSNGLSMISHLAQRPSPRYQKGEKRATSRPVKVSSPPRQNV
ncbi:hypothetical protein E2C01_044162 [Portunus trituberculatus]|uniref:Secreted protein n=1 Tax=Portunus trituberculatus TaxID=210409 RepID=A0A5B7G1I9_PORTR|nr:hypothetical protein [Portunus trituberculatus]